MRKIFRVRLPGIHWTTVESPHTEPGIPDSNGCEVGIEFWLELKRAVGNRIPSLKIEQVGWLTRRHKAGGRTFIAVRKRSALDGDQLFLFSGEFSSVLREKGLAAALTLFIGTGGPSKWNWESIRHVLLLKDIHGSHARGKFFNTLRNY